MLKRNRLVCVMKAIVVLLFLVIALPTPVSAQSDQAARVKITDPSGRLGDVLLDMNMVKEDRLRAALEEQKRTGRRLGDILVESGELKCDDLLKALKEQGGGDAGVCKIET